MVKKYVPLSKITLLEEEKVQRLERILQQKDEGKSADWAFNYPDAREILSMRETFRRKMPAVNVIQLGGEYYLIDGHHRYAIAKNLGRSSMLVNTVPNGTNGIRIIKSKERCECT